MVQCSIDLKDPKKRLLFRSSVILALRFHIFMSSTKQENWCWAANWLGANGPTFVRECRIESDQWLTRCTMFVYTLTFLAMLIYAIFKVELTESKPATVWVSPRYVPKVGINSSYLNQSLEYCDPGLVGKYKCEGDGSWKAAPSGCANIPAAHIPQWRIFRESGDGIFVPTAWIYEESQLQPAVSGQCNESQCVESEHLGPQGQLFCKCTKTSDLLFVPWTEHAVSFAYQMHLEVPDLDVISAGGVNTPYCESFLTDDQFEGSKCPVGDEECLRTSQGVSSMPCRVFLRIPERKQGLHYNVYIDQDPNPMPLDNTDYFSTNMWGTWTVNVGKVLRRVTDLTESLDDKNLKGNPLLCSFISTGGSIVIKHTIEPLPKTEFKDWKQHVICRLGRPGWIKWLQLHHKRGKSWPCFQLHIEIMYLPLNMVEHEDTIVENASTGSIKIQHHKHFGLSIITKGETGRVHRFTLTSFFLGLSSILDVWLIRLFIMQMVLSWGCFGPVGKLYRKALCQRVEAKEMISAWFSRSVTAMTIFKAAGKVADQSTGCLKDDDHVSQKIRDRLKGAGAIQTKPGEVHNWVKFQLRCLGMDFSNPVEDEEEKWLKANDAKGNITIEDIKVLYEEKVHLDDVGNEEHSSPLAEIRRKISECSNKTSEHGEDRSTYACLPSHRSLVCERVAVDEQSASDSPSSSETVQHCT